MSELDDHPVITPTIAAPITPPVTPPITAPIASHRLQEKVPFITAWSGETFDSPRPVWRGNRIGYANERPQDRDAFGVLWRRVTNRPGAGSPQFGVVHHGRQRRAMGGMLCQVCARPTRPEATEDGILFLLGQQEYESDPWPEPIVTTHPPLCARCAVTSVNACPHLRGHYVALRCRTPRLYGVNGILYRANRDSRPQHAGGDPIQNVPYTSVRRHFVQAGQAVVRLDRYTLVALGPAGPSVPPAPPVPSV